MQAIIQLHHQTKKLTERPPKTNCQAEDCFLADMDIKSHKTYPAFKIINVTSSSIQNYQLRSIMNPYQPHYHIKTY